MDEPEASSDSPKRDEKTAADAPSILPIPKEKTPEDAQTAEPKTDEKKSDTNLKPLPQSLPTHQSVIQRMWAWIRRDTTSSDWLIVLLTAVIAGTSYLQWHEIHSGSKDTHELAVSAGKQAAKMSDVSDAADKIRKASQDMVAQNQRIADNASASLEASNRQSKAALDAAINNAKLEERPWVGFRDFRCDNCTSDSNGLRIGKMFGLMENTGKTPAIEMVVRAVWTDRIASAPIPDYDSIESQMRPHEVPPNIPKDLAEQMAKALEIERRFSEPPKTVLPPNAIRPLPIVDGAALARNVMERIENRKIFYVVGKITYRSTWKDQEHSTRFCLMNEYGSDFHFCPAGNSMD